MTESTGRVGGHSAPIRRRNWDVFISYARSDATVAHALAKELEDCGLSTWFDARLRASEPLEAIQDALDSSGTVIVLLSRDSMSSRWLNREVGAVWDNMPRSCVFTVAIGEVDITNAPSWLTDRPWLRLRDQSYVHKFANQLVPALKQALGIEQSWPGTARIMGDLPPRVPLVGVDAYLKQLMAQHHGTTWIIGMGGSGKTQLAREFVFQVRSDTDFVMWLSGARQTAAEIKEALRHLPDIFGPSGRGVIVLDGLEDLTDAQDATSALSEVARQHRVLITSREVQGLDTIRNPNSSVLVVGPLPQTAVSQYLDAFAPTLSAAERAEVSRIAQLTGGSPLALRLIVEVLRTQSLDEISAVASTPRLIIKRTLMQLVDRLSADEKRRLSVLSFCSRILKNVRVNDEWALPGDDTLFAQLNSWGVCSEQADGAVFMHPMVVEILRQTSSPWALSESIAYVAPRLPDPDGPDARELLPDIVELSELTELDWYEVAPENLAELLIWEASVWRASGEPERAAPLCSRALALSKESGVTLLHIRAMNLQSALAFDQGRLASACSIERKAAELAAIELGKNHPIAMASLVNLATSLRAQGNLPEAITLLREVVVRSRHTLKKGDPDRVAAQANLAVCLRDAGLIDEAMATLKEAGRHSESPRARLKLDQILAALLVDQGRLDEASDTLQQCILRSSDSPEALATDSLTVRANFAMVQARRGRIHEAVAIQSDVIDRCDITLGHDHPYSLTTRANYASLLTQTGRAFEALPLLEQLVRDRRRVLGNDHLDTLQSQLLVARSTRDSGDDRKALRIYSDLLSDVVRVLGPDHAMSLTVREEIALQYLKLGDIGAAELAYRELLADLGRVLPPGHPMVTRVTESSERFKEA